jgi:FkbM family methyltransferase
MLFITSLSPSHHNADIQLDAVNSWIALGNKVQSFNTPAEIEKLQAFAELVEFIPVSNPDETGLADFNRPLVKITHMINCFRQQTEHETCLLINSDIELLPEHDIMQAIEEGAKTHFILGKRWNYQTNKRNMSYEPYGIDFFALNKQNAALYPENRIYCMGECFWDYWIVCYPLIGKYPMYAVHERFGIHKVHQLQWKQETWHRLYGYFKDEMCKHIGGFENSGDMYSNVYALYQHFIARANALPLPDRFEPETTHTKKTENRFEEDFFVDELLMNVKQRFNLKIKGLLHVGGYDGVEMKIYSDLGINKVVFFEPLKSNFEKLLKNVAPFDGVTCHPVALGKKECEMPMFVEVKNGGMSSSLLQPKLHTEFYPHIPFDVSETVKVVTLDSYRYADCNVLVMDTQGFELEVLKGAKKTLKTIDYIITEANLDEIFEGCAKLTQLTDFLDKAGFTLIQFTQNEFLWGEAFFMRKEIAIQHYRDKLKNNAFTHAPAITA